MRKWMTAGTAAALLVTGAGRAVEAKDAAGAVDVKIADDVASGRGLFSGVDYGKSDRLGRAWLVLHYQSRGPCEVSDGECDTDVPVNVSVPGLAYDAAARNVVYRAAGGEPVVCADVRHRAFGEAIAATGACTFRVEKVDRFVDDGFEGRKERREELHLVVRSPAPAAALAAGRGGGR